MAWLESIGCLPASGGRRPGGRRRGSPAPGWPSLNTTRLSGVMAGSTSTTRPPGRSARWASPRKPRRVLQVVETSTPTTASRLASAKGRAWASATGVEPTPGHDVGGHHRGQVVLQVPRAGADLDDHRSTRAGGHHARSPPVVVARRRPAAMAWRPRPPGTRRASAPVPRPWLPLPLPRPAPPPRPPSAAEGDDHHRGPAASRGGSGRSGSTRTAGPVADRDLDDLAG